MQRSYRKYFVFVIWAIVVVAATHHTLCVRSSALDLKIGSSTINNCSLAEHESNNFFPDIPNDSWLMIKQKAHDMQPNTKGDPNLADPRSGAWWQNNFEPEFVCQHERRVGVLGDGGKWVCDPHRIAQKNSSCLVYSIGSNGDASFEASVLKDISPQCEIHTFDMRDFSMTVAQQTSMVTQNPNVHFHKWGLSSKTQDNFKTLGDTVIELGHIGRTIDIFKIDCEGCEVETFLDWTSAPAKLQQILVEIHPGHGGIIKLPETTNMFRSLHDAGYVITHKEPNIEWILHSGVCVEYAFLLLSPEFWV